MSFRKKTHLIGLTFLITTIASFYFLSTYTFYEKELIQGKITFESSSKVFTDESGYITSINKNSNIKTGEKLLSINNSKNMLSNSNNVSFSSQAIKSIESKIKQNLSEYTSKNEQLISEIKHYEESIELLGDQLEQSLEAYEQFLEIKSTERDRYKNEIVLLSKGTISKIDLENRRKSLQSLKNEATTLAFTISEIKTELSSLNTKLNNTKSTISTVRLAYMSNKESLKNDLLSATKTERFNITAPTSGKLDLSNIKIGQFLGNGTYVGQIIENQTLIGYLNVNHKTKANINYGDTIIFSVDSYPYVEYGFLVGTVISITPIEDLDSSHVIKISINETKNKELMKLRNGMSIQSYIDSNPTSLLKLLLLPIKKVSHKDIAIEKLL